MKPPTSCVILVPYAEAVDPACERGLAELERRGLEVRRRGGRGPIDEIRNRMATEALADGFDELFWIDSDIRFQPDDVEKLRLHDVPVSAGVYSRRGGGFACHFLPHRKAFTLGAEGSLQEVMYLGLGFLHSRRAVYETLIRQGHTPEVRDGAGHLTYPFFLPTVVPDGRGHWYLGEDFAFCDRVRAAGFPIRVDPSIRLGHWGSKAVPVGHEAPDSSSFELSASMRRQPEATQDLPTSTGK